MLLEYQALMGLLSKRAILKSIYIMSTSTHLIFRQLSACTLAECPGENRWASNACLLLHLTNSIGNAFSRDERTSSVSSICSEGGTSRLSRLTKAQIAESHLGQAFQLEPPRCKPIAWATQRSPEVSILPSPPLLAAFLALELHSPGHSLGTCAAQACNCPSP